ncbi:MULTISPECIES: GSCFA domain-containing protein [Streptomyces]|uniref:GSCFA domain-containing protein n=1 Tax=Streptomyces broussonetiae TaxID=2686304 RepID=A0ABV5EDG1_9ACTN|nr:GSCFA domain-containing protein [Streptomyces sp. B93]MBQ1090469.1 GSCFA domain-containing protein [Streptomyces sp. B93]
MSHPYARLPARSFWRTAVAEPGPADITDLWTPKFAIGTNAPVVTAGSCFAAHIGRALLSEGMHWYDAELPPPGLTPAEQAARGYRRFSFRTGNIYTAAALRQWVGWALGEEKPPEEVWQDNGAFYDPYRPSVEPDGFASREDLLAAREVTLAAIRTALARANVLVFTLGLTEAWHDTATDTVLPTCPGTVRGTFDPSRHVLRQHTVARVVDDLTAVLALARGVNPRLRTVLTVSPVPLTATATGRHALVATTHSKSVLRAAAGQLADASHDVDYFPSYEIVAGFPYRAAFFAPNLRTVTPEGVAFVMRHFLGALRPGSDPVTRSQLPAPAPATPVTGGEDHWCDDAVLDYYNPSTPLPPAR